MEWELLLVTVPIATAGGVIRGITGFGGALVMTPPLSVVLGPQLAVPTVLLLEAFAAGPMLPAAARIARFRLIVPICVAACLSVPLGVALLVAAEPQVMRRLIAGIVILFSLILLKGLRFAGPQRQVTSIALGAFSGVLLGATSIGMPPIILYLLSGPDPVAVTRANLTLCIVGMSIVALVMLWAHGILNLGAARSALILCPCYYIGVKLGIHFFPKFNELRFRQFTLVLLAAVSTVLLFI